MVNGMVSTMKTTVAMDQAGRVVVPQAVRRALNLRGRARFQLELTGEKLELTVLPENTPRLEKTAKGLWVVRGTGQPFDAVEALAEMRRERR